MTQGWSRDDLPLTMVVAMIVLSYLVFLSVIL